MVIGCERSQDHFSHGTVHARTFEQISIQIQFDPFGIPTGNEDRGRQAFTSLPSAEKCRTII